MSNGSRRRPAARAASSRRSAGTPAQHRIGRVRLGLVGEVDPRHAAVEHPAREHRDVDVRRLDRASPGPATGARLDRDDLEAAVAVLGAEAREAAKARELRAARRSRAGRRSGRRGRACQVSISESGTGSPAPSYTVPVIRIAPGVSSGTANGPAVPRQPDREVRPDGLRGVVAKINAPPRTASGRGRAGRCRTRTRAPSSGPCRGSRTARSSARAPRRRAPS